MERVEKGFLVDRESESRSRGTRGTRDIFDFGIDIGNVHPYRYQAGLDLPARTAKPCT